MAQIDLARDFIDDATAPYLGRWRRLVSTTNWEKGRIIHEWRAALVAAAAPAAEYSDDAWSRHVGSVSGQHAGRLRRVYERFGDVHDGYAGLYWSHFQAAIDWNDAEMWLEGSLQNRWSVAEMRRERWQAFGGPDAERLQDEGVVVAELDEDADSLHDSIGLVMPESSGDAAARGSTLPKQSGGSTSELDNADSVEKSSADHRLTGKLKTPSETDEAGDGRDTRSAPFRPFADLPSLPDDLSEAFESFKLAILRHKTAGWQEVSRGDVLRSLDALKALATSAS